VPPAPIPYGKLRQEYSYKKLSKSDNWFLSYSRKCRGCFLRYSDVDRGAYRNDANGS